MIFVSLHTSSMISKFLGDMPSEVHRYTVMTCTPPFLLVLTEAAAILNWCLGLMHLLMSVDIPMCFLVIIATPDDRPPSTA